MRKGSSHLGIITGTKEYRQLYYQTYKERQLKLGKLWYKNNKERKLAGCKAWRDRNKLRSYKNQIKRLYNLDGHTYDQMLITQDNKCKLCKDLLLKPIVDHNHVTKVVRGLLCQRCNILIGAFESITRLSLEESIKSYLDFNGGV